MWDWIKSLFARLLSWFRKPRATTFRWYVDGRIFEEDPMAVLLTTSQKVALAVQPLDNRGFPARVDGFPVWTQTDNTVGQLTTTANTGGLQAEFVAYAPGITTITVTADADLGVQVRNIIGTLDIMVEAAEATTLVVTAGPPQQQ